MSRLVLARELIKKFLRRMRSLWRHVPTIVTVSLATCMVGLAAGFWMGRASAPGNTQTQSTLSGTTKSSETSRIESAYTYGKDRLAADQEKGRLTKDQADDVRHKLDELYAFRKQLEQTHPGDAQEQRNQKRQELRDWARSHELSTRYFTLLY